MYTSSEICHIVGIYSVIVSFFIFIYFILCPDLQVIKLFICSIQLSMKFILLINVKMPTVVGILTFINRINTSSENFLARKSFVFLHLSFHEPVLKFHAQLG